MNIHPLFYALIPAALVAWFLYSRKKKPEKPETKQDREKLISEGVILELKRKQ